MADINRTYIFDSEIIYTGGTSGGTNTDDYTISAVLNGTNLEFTRISGGTYSVDLSSVTITATTSDDYTVSATLSGSTLEFTRVSGATYSVDLSSLSVTGVTSGPVIFDIDTSGNTTYIGYGEINACKIRQVITLSGYTYSAYWSNGEETLDKIWINRLSYSYF